MTSTLETTLLTIKSENPSVLARLSMITVLDTISETPSNCNISCDADVAAVTEYIKLLFNHVSYSTLVLKQDKNISIYFMNTKTNGLNKIASKLFETEIYGRAFVLCKSPINPNLFIDFSIENFEKVFPQSVEITTLETLESLVLNPSIIRWEKRSDDMKKYEEDTSFGEIVAKIQFMKNREGGQKEGTKTMVRRITEKAFNQMILPNIKSMGTAYYSSYTYEKYLTYDKEAFPFYQVIFNSYLGQWVRPAFAQLGNFDSSCYRILVPSFDHRISILWGQLADSDVSRDRSILLQKEIEKELSLPQGSNAILWLKLQK
jgi:hypothetical protein